MLFPTVLRVGNKRRRSESMKWEQESLDLRKTLGLGPDSRPWTGRAGLQLHGIKDLPRELDILDIVWAKACRASGKALDDMSVAKGLTTDPTQSATWAVPKYDKLGTQLKATRIYSYELDRVILGCDILSLMGYEHHLLDFVDEESAKDMAGEAIAVPEMGLVLMALLCVLNADALFERPPVMLNLTELDHTMAPYNNDSETT